MNSKIKALAMGALLSTSMMLTPAVEAHEILLPHEVLNRILFGIDYNYGHKHSHRRDYYRDYRRSDSHGYRNRDRYKRGDGHRGRDHDRRRHHRD